MSSPCPMCRMLASNHREGCRMAELMKMLEKVEVDDAERLDAHE